jgi:branched-chain amino acid transport system substrate-binding protein
MSGRRSSRAAAVALVVVLALVAAACGSSGDDKSSSGKDGGGGSSSTSAPPTGTPVKIGWIGTVTSATVTGPNGGKEMMEAWVKWTNAHGGVSGHPVEAFYADDKADPAVGLAGVKDLVENKGAVAIVGSFAGSTQQTWASYVLEKKIPVINGALIDALWFTNPMFYPVGGSVIADTWGMMKSAAVAGYKKVSVILCTEVAACAQAQALFKNNATAVGLEMSYAALASQTQASYTAECLSAKRAGAEAVAPFINAVVFARDCARQQFKPAYINADLGPTLTIIKQVPEFNNIIGSSEHWPCLDKTLPASKDLYAALKAYHPNWLEGGGDHDNFSSLICAAWAGGVAFSKAVANSGVAASAPVTSADLIKGLAMFKNEELGGLAPSVTYSDGTKPNAEVKCTYLYKWKDQKFEVTKAADGKLYSCYG